MTFTVRAMKPDEIKSVGKGLARAFPHGDWQQEWTQRYPQRPGYTPSMHRVGVLNNQVIAHALVESYTLRYGNARLRVAGIGKVYCDEAHRSKGYAAAVLRDALTYAIEHRAHLALLNGIRGYYGRFGFYPVFPRYHMTFDAHEAAALDKPLSLREPMPREIPMIAALFERHWNGRVSFLRSPESWIWRVMGGDDNCQTWIVAEGDGSPQGYIAGRDFASPDVELVANTAPAALTLLSICGQLAVDAGHSVVRWLMPPDDALIAFAQQILPISLSAAYEPDGGWMARVIDAQGLVDALLPEITAQARMLLSDLSAEKLSISPKPQGVEIRIRGQSAAHTVLSQHDFIQLLFGSLSAATLGLRDGLSADSIYLLQALFPPRVAALGAWDWF